MDDAVLSPRGRRTRLRNSSDDMFCSVMTSLGLQRVLLEGRVATRELAGVLPTLTRPDR
jgi:hypothetical protein